MEVYQDNSRIKSINQFFIHQQPLEEPIDAHKHVMYFKHIFF